MIESLILDGSVCFVVSPILTNSPSSPSSPFSPSPDPAIPFDAPSGFDPVALPVQRIPLDSLSFPPPLLAIPEDPNWISGAH